MKHSRLPSREELVAFIRERSGKVGTREIARAFGAKNADRAALNRMLRELANSGQIDRVRKRLHNPGTLPPVVLADVTGRDADGEFLARPTEWDETAHGAPPVIRIVIPRRPRPGEVAGVGDRVLLRIEKSGEEETTARVIKLLDRAKHRVLGVFRGLPGGGGRLVPVDKKQLGREMAIPADRSGGAVDGDLVAVEVARNGRLGLPMGSVVERLGSIKSERAISLIAIHSHDIPHVFARALLDEADAAQPATLAGREDWRSVPFVTIDPPDAKDHDDAVHAVPDPDPRNAGGHLVSVAIADVAHYVRPGSALDREAVRRGNSVYFPDRVVPMLPERISNDLCSLRPNEDRPALAVRMVIGADGRKRSHTFHRVMMRSAAKLSYEEAQFAVSGRADEVAEPLVKPVLAPLYAAYETVRRARDERSPLDLDVPEHKILLKGDGSVDRVIVPPRLESHRLIEEFMILANVAAAESCERARVPLIYRVHDEPSQEKLNALREFLATIDIALPKGGVLKPDGFNRILAQVKGREVGAAGQPGRAAQPGAGRIFAGEFRPFRPQPAPLRPFHFADPPLRRPGGASRPDPRTETRQRRAARRRRCAGAGRSCRQYFRHRTPRHEGRARDRRPADRAFSRRPDRRHLRRPYFRRHPRRPVRRARRHRRRRFHPGALHRR